MGRVSTVAVVALLLGCGSNPGPPPLDYSASWQALPVDSLTESPLSAPGPAEVMTVVSLDSLHDIRWDIVGTWIHMLDDGFVISRSDIGRLLRFDSLGRRVADIPMRGVTDPRAASVCVGSDSVLLVTDARAVSGPRDLIWLALGPDADTTQPASTELVLPPWSLDVSCLRIAGRWVVKSTRLAEPGNFSSRAPIELWQVAPGVGASELPFFALPDSSVRLHDSEGKMTAQVSPWSPPLLIGADARGHLYLVTGPSGVVRIVDTTGAGVHLRGITPRPLPLSREMIDSVADARWDNELRHAARLSATARVDTTGLGAAVQSIRSVTPGTPLPEVDRLLVGADGSFALLTSVWRAADGSRWDLFDPDGRYLGAVLLPKESRGVGVQHGSVWYVHGTASGAELVRVRPVAAPH